MSSKLISQKIVTISIVESDLDTIKMVSIDTDEVNLAVHYVLVLSDELVLHDDLIL